MYLPEFCSKSRLYLLSNRRFWKWEDDERCLGVQRESVVHAHICHRKDERVSLCQMDSTEDNQLEPYYWDYPRQRDTISILGRTTGTKVDWLVDLTGKCRMHHYISTCSVWKSLMGIQPPHTVVSYKNISISAFVKTEKMADSIDYQRTSNRTRKIKLILTPCLFLFTPEKLKGEKGGR